MMLLAAVEVDGDKLEAAVGAGEGDEEEEVGVAAALSLAKIGPAGCATCGRECTRAS